MISVIVPVYQVAALLPACLDSLAAQLLGPEEIEFILVNDGSTDAGPEICRSYAARDPRFVVLDKPNGGVSSARNLGLAHARGAWIGFVDGDDWVEPEMFSRLLACAEATGADAVMCGYREYLPQGGWLDKGCEPAACCTGREALRQVLRRTGYFTALWNKLFRRDALCPHGEWPRFDGTLCVGEDETWLLRVLPGMARVAFVPQVLYHWRTRGDSASRKEVITPASMSVLRAKAMAEELAAAADPALRGLTRSRLLNDCYHLKVIAYRTRSKQALRQVNRAFRGRRLSWLVSSDVPLLRKAKVLAMSVMIALHLPRAWVDRAFYVRRSHG